MDNEQQRVQQVQKEVFSTFRQTHLTHLPLTMAKDQSVQLQDVGL